MGNCVPHSGRVYHYSKAIQSNNVTRCKLLVVLNREGTNTARIVTLQEMYTDD